MSSKNKEEILDCIPLLHPYSMDEIYTMLKRHGCKISHEETYNLVEKNLYKIMEYGNWNIKLKQANIIKNKIKGVFILRMEYVKIF